MLVFFGYLDGVKTYKIFFIQESNKNLIIYNDFLFNEIIFPFLSSQVAVELKAKDRKEGHKMKDNDSFQIQDGDDEESQNFHCEENQ